MLRYTLSSLFLLPILLLGCPPADPKDSPNLDDTGTPDSDTQNQDSDTGVTDSDTEIHESDTGVPDSDTQIHDSDTSIPDTDTGHPDTDTSPPDTGDSTVIDTGDSGTTIDTGDTASANCTDADLLWETEARDANGNVGGPFTTRDTVSAYGVVRNPCSNDIQFTTQTSCLVGSYSLVDSRGMGMGMAVACRPGQVTWTVPAGGTVEESAAWGRLSVDTYTQGVTFDYQNHSASVSFVVQ